VGVQVFSTATDAVLLDNFIQHRDEEAFADLVTRYGPMVFGVCQRVLRNAHEAEDVAQSTFLHLASRANAIRRSEAVAAWLHQTARHLSFKHLRKETRRLRREHLFALSKHDIHEPDPLDALTIRELMEIFDEELGRLRDQNRLPLILCALEGLSQKQAADRLGWSPHQVKGGLERGRAQLRRALERRGLIGAAVAISLEAMHEFVKAQPLPAGLTSAIAAAAIASLNGGAGGSTVIVKALGMAKQPLHLVSVSHLKAMSLAALVSGLLLAGAGAIAIFWQANGSQSDAETFEISADGMPGLGNAQRVDVQGDALPEGALARLGTVRWRARGEISALALSPDGKTAAAAGEGRLRLIDVATGKPLSTLSDLGMGASMVAFSPDGTRLAVCDASGAKIKVWRARDGQLLQAFDIVWIRRIDWTTDGELQGVVVDKGAIVVRNLTNGKRIAVDVSQLDGPPSPANPITFSSLSGTVAFTDYRANQPEIHIWDATTGKKRSVLYCPNGPVLTTALSSNGNRLASLSEDTRSGKGTVHIWDVATAKITHTLPGDLNQPLNVAFSPDDKFLVAVCRQNVQSWEVATGREVSRSQGMNSFAKEIAFSPDGKSLFTAQKDGPGLHVWELATGTLRPAPVAHQSAPTSVAFSQDGSRIVSASMDGDIIVWDVNTGSSRTRLHQPSWWPPCLFSDDGLSLYSLGKGEKIRISDAVNGREQHVLELGDPDRRVTRLLGQNLILLDDHRTLVALSGNYSTRLGRQESRETLIAGWDSPTQQILFRRRRDVIESGAAISPDGRILAVGQLARDAANPGNVEIVEGGGPVLLEDLRTGQPLFSLGPHEGQERPNAFSPDGRVLVTTKFHGDSITLQLWETATGGKLLTIPSATNGRFAFSPDGRLLAMGPVRHEISLWDLQLGKEVRRIRGFDANVVELAFSPDGRRLVSGLSDSTLLVWDVAGQNHPAQHIELNAAEINAAWLDLAHADAASAFRARKLLAGSPGRAAQFLKEKLKPEAPPNAAVVKKLIANLGGDRFAEREKAQTELSAIGEPVEQALQDVLANKPTLEMRRRIDSLLKEIRGPVRNPNKLQALRALAVLEDIDTPEARSILQDISHGEPRACLTREPKGSLDRLSRLERARQHAGP
jgi:RNA polymerase sigma factor (sigma-70 family)